LGGPFWWFNLPERPRKFGSSNEKFKYNVIFSVSQTTPYIMSFNFLCLAIQKFHFERQDSTLPPEDCQIWSKQLSTNNFVHMSFNLGGSILGGGVRSPKEMGFAPKRWSLPSYRKRSFQFLCQLVQRFGFWGLFPPPPQKTPKFGSSNCLTNNFLNCEFQLSMLSSSKVSFWEVYPHPGRRSKVGSSNKKI